MYTDPQDAGRGHPTLTRGRGGEKTMDIVLGGLGVAAVIVSAKDGVCFLLIAENLRLICCV